MFTPEEILLNYIDEPYFLPGESNRECETNYILLGLVIKEIISSPLGTEIKNRYLDILDLNDTYCNCVDIFGANIVSYIYLKKTKCMFFLDCFQID